MIPQRATAARLLNERRHLVASLERELARHRAAADTTRAASWPTAVRLPAWQKSATKRLTALLGWPLTDAVPPPHGLLQLSWRKAGRRIRIDCHGLKGVRPLFVNFRQTSVCS